MTAHSTAPSPPDVGSDGSSAPASTDVGAWWGDSPARSVAGHAVLAVGAAILVGIVLGLVWRWVTPPIEVVIGGGTSTEEANRVFGAEGVYTVIMVCAGLASAALARTWLRHAGPLAVLGVVAAGFAGSLVAWRVGVWAGPEPIGSTDRLVVGQVVLEPINVHSHGLLLAWSIAAVFALLWIAALSSDPPPAQQPSG